MRRKAFATCPDCDGRMSEGAARCLSCDREARRGKPSKTRGLPRGAVSDDAVHTISRRESIITFRDKETGRERTLQCFGPTAKAQIANGRARCGEGDWQVECRSTPLTILQDLRPENHSEHRAEMLRRAVT